MYETEPINLYDNVLFTLFTERIWPTLSPIFWLLNILGVCVVIFMFLKYWSTRKKLDAINKEMSARVDGLFAWVKEKPQKNPRWDRVEKLAASPNPSDWRVAILEADSMLDELIVKLGYQGEDMGERMRSINAETFPYISEAWRVHKLRNIVAHETSYDLQRGETEDAIDAYNLIFKSLSFI